MWRRIKLQDAQHLRDVSGLTPAVNWILKTSTDPEVISLAAWLLPTIKWIPEHHINAIYLRLLGTFGTCLHVGVESSSSARQRALACGRALHHIICFGPTVELNSSNDVSIDSGALELWLHWHDVALPCGLQDCERSFIQYNTTPEDYYEDQARDALQLTIVTGCPGFLKPTDVTLIWDGVFGWSGDQRMPEDFDWLVDFLVHFRRSHMRDFGAMADALLALSAMQGLGSTSRREIYLHSIIFSMEEDKPSRLRHSALRAVYDARAELINIADQEKGEFRDQLLTELPPALLTSTRRIAPQNYEGDPDALFNPGREYFYLRLIFTLAKQDDWRAQLEKSGHIDRCVSLLEHLVPSNDSTSSSEPVRSHPYYLAGALMRMNVSERYQGSDLADRISELEWWGVLKGAWSAMWWNDLYNDDSEVLEALPDLVKYTLESLETQAAQYNSKGLVRFVDRIYQALEDNERVDPLILSNLQIARDALDSSGS